MAAPNRFAVGVTFGICRCEGFHRAGQLLSETKSLNHLLGTSSADLRSCCSGMWLIVVEHHQTQRREEKCRWWSRWWKSFLTVKDHNFTCGVSFDGRGTFCGAKNASHRARSASSDALRPLRTSKCLQRARNHPGSPDMFICYICLVNLYIIAIFF